MKINDNGVVRDMTPEEIAEMERMQAEMPDPPEDLIEVRLTAVEATQEEIVLAMADMMGGAL